MDITVCDYTGCQDEALVHVKVIKEGHNFKGFEFDACSIKHLLQHFQEIKADPGGEEVKIEGGDAAAKEGTPDSPGSVHPDGPQA